VADNLTSTAKGTISSTNPTSGQCGPKPQTQTSTPLGGEQGRCGFGPRLPLLLISPCSKANYVDHNLSDQASILNFIEYNWNLPAIPGSFDQALAATDKAEGIPFDLAGMFDFWHCDNLAWPLDPTTGQVNLAGADLHGRDLGGADLAWANLSGATLHGVDLRDAFLHGANLQGADLNGVNLRGADLTDANLTGATLRGADTRGATWSITTCPDGTNSTADGGTCIGHI
jgi:uncharacterized protein YjbI with pentapeptide repeats